MRPIMRARKQPKWLPGGISLNAFDDMAQGDQVQDPLFLLGRNTMSLQTKPSLGGVMARPLWFV